MPFPLPCTSEPSGPCGSVCSECPVSCGPEAPEFDPAERAAFLAGLLTDPADPR
jgi:hypothetical protein